MTKHDIDYTQFLSETMKVAGREGILLVSQAEGRANIMTIGWTLIGPVWGRQVCIVMVRPGRYTYAVMEKSADFTVNVLPRKLVHVAEFCGTASGRDHDKFGEMKITPVMSKKVTAPIIGEAVIHYECKVLYRTDLVTPKLDPIVRQQNYRGMDDYHRLYFGEIVAVYAADDAAQQVA